MRPLLFALTAREGLAGPLAEVIGAELGHVEIRRFPDEETYFRYVSSPKGRQVIVLCSLDRPDEKYLPLVFAAATARDLGARSVGLVCPYLAYMRQDRRFRPGEAITSAHFARMLSGEFDWLVTVDPHLHRRRSLSEIYAIPAVALHAGRLIGKWVGASMPSPLLVGPDIESEQWVSAVAKVAEAPYAVLRKVRQGDRDVRISIPDLSRWPDRTPVLVDDIVSTGRTMIETTRLLIDAGMRPPVCVAVHGIFAGSSYAELLEAGASRTVSTNTITHQSNAIDVSDLLAGGVRLMFAELDASRPLSPGDTNETEGDSR